MDFSENLSGTPEFEPQSAHFSKRKLSLHCTVKHDFHIETEKSSNCYYYHLFGDLTHDAVFTSPVFRDLTLIWVGGNLTTLSVGFSLITQKWLKL